MAVPKDPREIETAEPFRSLFPIDPAVRDLVADSIRAGGYDPGKPILAWRDAFGQAGRTVVVDGHTRRAVAIDLKLPTVQVTMRRFANVDDAIAAAIGEQAQRRNLNPSQLAVHVLTMLDHLNGGGSGGQGTRNDLNGRSAKQLGEMIGVTSRTIERARQLIAFADDELLAQVKAGDIGLKTAVERAKRTDDTELTEDEAEQLREAEAVIARGTGRAPGPRPDDEHAEAKAGRALDREQARPGHSAEAAALKRAVQDQVETVTAQREAEAAERGGWSDLAGELWRAVETIRAFDEQEHRDAMAERLAGCLLVVIGYWGVNYDDPDETIQEYIYDAAWDENETPGPAPWEIAS